MNNITIIEIELMLITTIENDQRNIFARIGKMKLNLSNTANCKAGSSINLPTAPNMAKNWNGNFLCSF